MSMNFAQQQQLLMLDRLTESVIARRESISNIASTLGPKYAEIIQERLNALGHAGNSTAEKRSVIMRQKRERNELAAEHAKERTSVGMLAYSPKQEVFTAVVREQLDGCESGEYPTATKTAQAVVGDKSTKLLAKTAKTCLRKAFDDNKEHPAMQRIHSVADNSTMVAAASGNVSNCLGALTNSHKVARRLELIEQEQERALRSEKQLQARIASLEARRDLEDEGKDWRTEASRLLAEKPSMSQRALARAVGVSQTAMRKYLLSLEV